MLSFLKTTKGKLLAVLVVVGVLIIAIAVIINLIPKHNATQSPTTSQTEQSSPTVNSSSEKPPESTVDPTSEQPSESMPTEVSATDYWSGDGTEFDLVAFMKDQGYELTDDESMEAQGMLILRFMPASKDMYVEVWNGVVTVAIYETKIGYSYLMEEEMKGDEKVTINNCLVSKWMLEKFINEVMPIEGTGDPFKGVFDSYQIIEGSS